MSSRLHSLIGVMVASLSLMGCSAISSPPGSPTPTQSAPTSSAERRFPDSTNTGVPDGTQLTPYEGSCAFDQPGMVVEGKTITCDRVVVLADNVTIRSSIIHGWIDLSPSDAHLTLEDSEVDAGASQTPAIGFYNVTVRRTEIRGGQTSVQCASNCLIEDSLLHDQMKPVGEQHLGGYLSNGGSNVVLRHNTVACTPMNNAKGGGCTGSIQIFGDFEPLINFRFESNLIKATPGGYCASFGYNPGAKYGDNPSQIVVVDNVFERGAEGKCGVWGAATSFLATGQGNIFSGNTWDDGKPLAPNT